MFDLSLISKLNGWSFVAAGILIVFSSLAGLALIISSLHKCLEIYDSIISLIEKKKKKLKDIVKVNLKHRFKISSALKDYAKKFRTISALTGEPFHLSDLIDNAEKRGLTSPSPNFVVDELLKANFIIKDDSRKFKWNSRLCEILL